MRNDSARKMALCGVTAALAVTVMCLVALIPVATFVCPVLCVVLLHFVFVGCGSKMAWVWYAVVAILSGLLGPDKEAAVIFLLLGYYPILKPRLDGLRFGFVCKLLLFNAAIAAAYGLIFFLFGLETEDAGTVGILLAVLTLLLGNVTFFVLDRLLTRISARK